MLNINAIYSNGTIEEYHINMDDWIILDGHVPFPGAIMSITQSQIEYIFSNDSINIAEEFLEMINSGKISYKILDLNSSVLIR